MSRLAVVPFALILSLGCASARRSTQEAPAALGSKSRREIVREILPQNVRVFLSEGGKPKRSASGVVVGTEATATGSSSYVITNAHALDTSGLSNPQLTVVVDGGPEAMEYVAEPAAVGEVPGLDLALLRVRGVVLPAAVLAGDEELEIGEDVVVVAAPFGRALSLSGGMVSHVDREPKTRLPLLVKTDAAIGYGASGGGVYSLSSGRLLAIVEGYRTAKVGFEIGEQKQSIDVPMPGETFAAPGAKVRRFLESRGFGRLVSESAPRASR